MSAPLLKLSHASCGYGTTTIVDDVSLTIHEGEAIALLGANGAGKSTLLKAIAGLATLRGEHQRTATLGYVPQHHTCDPTFPVTAGRVVEMGLLNKASWWERMGSMRRLRPQITQALELVGMSDKAKTRWDKLSGGQRQRIFIARALAAHPDLVLMDEPFNGLDQDSRQVLLGIIAKLKESGVALLISTHDPILAQRACDAGMLIVDGHSEVLDTEDAVERYLEATSVLQGDM